MGTDLETNLTTQNPNICQAINFDGALSFPFFVDFLTHFLTGHYNVCMPLIVFPVY